MNRTLSRTIAFYSLFLAFMACMAGSVACGMLSMSLSYTEPMLSTAFLVAMIGAMICAGIAMHTMESYSY